MIAQFYLFPEQASTAAWRVDLLFFFVLAICVVMSVLIAALLIYFAIRYRRRSETETPPPIHGSVALETLWSLPPLILGLIIFVWGADVYFDMYRPPADALQIYVVGKQWMWKVQHPDGQREINELHVPVGQPV
ncbi:MAG: cytochrome c oxidase subunit II transmembrane domain-containing protein, partial [Gemmataceae bacterium]